MSVIHRLESPSMQAQSDSPVDFEAVFEAYWPKIYAFLAGFTGDPEEAQDLALEVFMRLYSRPQLFQGGHNLGGWLYRVAANLGYNALRAHKRRRGYEARAETTRQASDPLEIVQSRQEQNQVRQVLAGMKKRSAKILFLRHTGLSYKDIAAAVGVAAGSVGTLLARAETDFEKRYRRLFGPQ